MYNTGHYMARSVKPQQDRLSVKQRSSPSQASARMSGKAIIRGVAYYDYVVTRSAWKAVGEDHRIQALIIKARLYRLQDISATKVL